uniref:Retrotrans_gag domain-containing protein n=1 Tax=Steinernema glaseri TaxID=37863 RepID=A0A1I7YI09_9BILA
MNSRHHKSPSLAFAVANHLYVRLVAIASSCNENGPVHLYYNLRWTPCIENKDCPNYWNVHGTPLGLPPEIVPRVFEVFEAKAFSRGFSEQETGTALVGFLVGPALTFKNNLPDDVKNSYKKFTKALAERFNLTESQATRELARAPQKPLEPAEMFAERISQAIPQLSAIKLKFACFLTALEKKSSASLTGQADHEDEKELDELSCEQLSALIDKKITEQVNNISLDRPNFYRNDYRPPSQQNSSRQVFEPQADRHLPPPLPYCTRPPHAILYALFIFDKALPHIAYHSGQELSSLIQHRYTLKAVREEQSIQEDEKELDELSREKLSALVDKKTKAELPTAALRTKPFYNHSA